MLDFLQELGLGSENPGTFSATWYRSSQSNTLSSYSPIDNSEIARVAITSADEYETVVAESIDTFQRWRLVPAPKRGELVREIAEAFRLKKKALAMLIATEVGKILPEAEGEVQEVIDIADFAVGLSRQLYGSTMHSERPNHRMYEQWHPLGAVGVISAFNFPVAVWSWNALLAAVCGNSVIWKASELTPLSAVATIKICESVARKHDFPGLFSLVTGDSAELGKQIAADRRLPLISATGSTAMGRSVSQVVSARLGRTLLELGGNNAVIVMNDADIELASRAVFFGAVGTAGQRCTTTRRLIVEKGILDSLLGKLFSLYRQVKVGDPREAGTLLGPLINNRAVEQFQAAVKRAVAEGGKVLIGGGICSNAPSNLYVEPTIISANRSMSITQEETFAPILYVIPFSSLDEAIEIQNDVPQGLSSALFTTNLLAAERFLSLTGSDCGIANINIGTSGAEIGGAFGGEKDTGGGREAGSDSWRAYMRRQTNTINYGRDLPLAQGIKFGE